MTRRAWSMRGHTLTPSTQPQAAHASREASLITYSIPVYPKWSGHGHGSEFVDNCKGRFDVIIADRVRPTAIGFWESLGFRDGQDGNWVYQMPVPPPAKGSPQSL
jgi:hypothetical protein